MPFTPFHFGPGLLYSIFMKKKRNVALILLASVIIDVEPVYNIISNRYLGTNYPLHGFWHTFLGATIAAIGLVIAWYLSEGLLMNYIGKKITVPRSEIIISALVSLLGTWTHVTLDAFLYYEMNPFYPILGNPLLSKVDFVVVYLFCVVSFFLGMVVWIFKLYNFKVKSKHS